ncbi:MAG: nitronate monooxygenase [Prevotellaceae bacterium]|nr:nitronate monooxygenase [Prevotellaceae bacterium]
MKRLKIGQYTINFPIIQGGMGIGVSWDRLAGAVSFAGGLGIISAIGTGYYQNMHFVEKVVDSRPYDVQNLYSFEALKAIVKNARKICGQNPLGVNIMCAINDYGRVVADACKSGIDIIISGAGLPTNLPEFTDNDPRIALVPIVSSAKALKIICKRWMQRYNRIPDAVVLEGPLSGGHQGFKYEQCAMEEYQLENLIRPVKDEIREWGDFPLIAAGGIWDKNDIDKVMALGADGVQMGTRFIGTYECDASEVFKQVLIRAEKEDIQLLKSPVGYPARGVRTNLINLADKKEGAAIKCISNCVSPCQRGKGAKEAGYCIANCLGDALAGKEDSGLFFTGANGYRLKEIISVKELMNKLINGE